MNEIHLTEHEEIFARKLLPSALIAAAILMNAKAGQTIREPEEIVVNLAHRLSRDAGRTRRSTPHPDELSTPPDSVELCAEEAPLDSAPLATLPPKGARVAPLE